MSASDSHLPPRIEPEYMSWPRPKLEEEYLKVRSRAVTLEFKLLDHDDEVRKAQQLIQALKECLDDE